MGCPARRVYFLSNVLLRFSSLLRIVIAVLAIFSLGAYGFRNSGHPYFNGVSLTLILFLGMTLYGFSGRFTSRRPPAIVITLTLILFVQLRLAVLIMLPESLLGHGSVTSGMMNATLGYMIGGIIACYLGLAAGYGRARAGSSTSPAVPNVTDGRFWALTGLLVVALFFTLTTFYQLGYIGATGDGSHLSFFQRYFTRLVSPQALFVMCVAAYLASTKRQVHRLGFAIILIAYGLSFVVRGSRSGIFEIIIFLLAGKIGFDGNFQIRIGFAKGVLVAALLPAAVAAYVIPTQLRAFWYGEEVTAGSLLESFALERAPDLISDISYRLSFIEPTLFPAYFDELGLHDVSHLVNVRTSLMSSVNRLIPGKPLGDMLFTEYAFGYFYNPDTGVLANSTTGRVDHVGYEWSMFGLAYQLFGYVGGTVFIFGFTALLGWILRWCRKSGHFKARVYGIFFVMVLVMWVRNLGWDNFVDAVGHNFFLLWVYVTGCALVLKGQGKIMAQRLPSPRFRPAAP